MLNKKKIIRVTTVPHSLGGLLGGQLRYMSEHFNVIGISSDGDGILEKVGIKEGVRVIPVEMTRKMTPFKDLKGLLQLYRIFRKEKPFIVHSHTPKAGTLSMIAAKLAGVPNRLHTIAGLPLVEAIGIKRSILNLVEKITYHCATKIYPNSYGLQKIIIHHKFTTPNKLMVIGKGSSNGINTDHFNPTKYNFKFKAELRKELGININDCVFVFVGRLVTDKGINELVAAYKLIEKGYNNTKLILVGPFERNLDPLKKETEDFIDNCNNILALGHQNDVRPYFAISDCLVFPSYREGFPNVVMQAGAMGIKSIVTDINGCNEIIEDKINGDIIPVKNVKEVFNKMKNFINKGDKGYNNICRKRITSNYDQQFIWEEILKEYNKLI